MLRSRPQKVKEWVSLSAGSKLHWVF